MSLNTDQLQVLLRQEVGAYRTVDYLAQVEQDVDRNAALRQAPRINERWREAIVEWAFRVVDHFDLKREVVSISMNFLDRCIADIRDECREADCELTFTEAMTNRRYQLLSLTCLYMAIKLNEFYHLRFPSAGSNAGTESTLDAVLRLSNGYFDRAQMEASEYEVFHRLKWHLHPPTPQQLLHHIVLHANASAQREIYDGSILDMSLFLIELSSMDYYFVGFQPSEVALAALSHSSGIDLEFPGADRVQIAACRKRLAYLHSAQGEPLPVPIVGDGRTTSPVSVVYP